MSEKRWILSVVLIAVIGIMAYGMWKLASDSGDAVPAAGGAGVTFSKESGAYEEQFTLKLSSEADTIYYTVDGSDPTESDTKQEYKDGIEITDRANDPNVLSAIDPVLYDAAHVSWDGQEQKYVSNVEVPAQEDVDKLTVVRAVSVGQDGSYSPVQSHSYLVGEVENHIQGAKEACLAAGMDLAVMSISVNPEDFFDEETGIYVKGKRFEKALQEYLAEEGTSNIVEAGRKFDANYQVRGKDGERTAHVDYFETDGEQLECKLQQDCGIRIQGNYSRSDLQKGLRLCARTDYGENQFRYPFFGENSLNANGEPMDSFEKLTLRNGGNCAFTTKFSDTYWQSLIQEMDCSTQASRPCVVYLNGEYWGLYILQEDYNNDYFKEKYGVDETSVVAYKGDAETYEIGYKLDEGELPAGEGEDYFFQELLRFYQEHKNLKSESDYKEFEKLVDVDSVRDYFAVNVWVNNKWDWPGKNWTAWKTTTVAEGNEYADGRWRLCYYDMDFGGISGSSDSYTNTIKEDNYKPGGLLDTDTENPIVLMYAYLMSNEEFRQSFYDELLRLSEENFDKESATAAWQGFVDVYKPLYTQFFTRYFGSEDAEWYCDEVINGGYASAQCIMDFLAERAENIQPMIDWAEDYY